jgi:hypothetical protein
VRHCPRLNRVACGISGRRRPTVQTLPEQPSSRAPVYDYCASVSPNVRYVSRERALTAPFRLRQCASGSDIYCAPERLSLCVATHSGRDKGLVGGVIHRAASWCPHES